MAVDNYISKAYLVSNLKNFKTVILDNAYAALSTTYTKDEVDNLISAIPKFDIKPVDSLPTTNISNTTVYLLKTSETEAGNLYTEYIYVNNKWEKLGAQTINLDGYYTSAEVDTLLSGKVDAVSGKGLSEADFTSAEKSKLAGIAEGAEVNVQADWNVEDTTSDAYILNKPTDLLRTGDIADWAKASTKPTYTASEVGAATATDISNAIDALDVAASTVAANHTVSGWSENNGKVNITTQAISITKSQVSDFPTSLPASNLTSTYSATDTANAVNGVAVASAISGKANATDVPSEETSNIDWASEWDATSAALG